MVGVGSSVGVGATFSVGAGGGVAVGTELVEGVGAVVGYVVGITCENADAAGLAAVLLDGATIMYVPIPAERSIIAAKRDMDLLAIIFCNAVLYHAVEPAGVKLGWGELAEGSIMGA